MVGITAYGGYIPYNRLKRAEIQKEFGISGMKGERAVASYDEDSATMAISAALNATHNRYGLEARGVYFATTTAPYKEKQSESLIAGVLDLPANIRTAEFSATLRAGTTALRAAADSVAAGSGPILVAAGDMREGGASGANEMAFGDGGAAIVLGGENLVAKLLGAASVSVDIVDTWRSTEDQFVRTWDERFQLTHGYGRAIPEVLKEVLKETGLKPEDFAKVVFPVAPKIQQILLKQGFQREQVADSLMNEVGLTGAAHPLLMLANELEQSAPGDKILVIAYGEGADALVFEVTDAIRDFKPLRTVREMIDSKKNELTYATYLKWRSRVNIEPPRRPEPQRPSSPFMHRRSHYNLALYGSRCEACGTVQFPAQEVCFKCRERGKMKDYGFRDKKGRLSTFSADHLSYSLSPPEMVAVIDFEGGGRIMCNMVDVEHDGLKIGQELEMTFRRMFTAGGIHTYFWKATGIR